MTVYGVVICPSCGRGRIADIGVKSSECPYCSMKTQTKYLRVVFRSDDQSEARDVLAKVNGFEGMPEKKKVSPDTDPYSTLVYRYEHCSSLEEKIDVLSKGLTELYGTFTLEDVEKFEPKNAEKILGRMLEDCTVHEVKYGRYKA